MKLYVKVFGGAAALFAAWPAMASEPVVNEPATYNPNFSFVGGVGVIDIEANELVYQASGSGSKLSQLVWKSTSPVISAEMTARSEAGWTAKLSGQLAFSGDSYMTSYRWTQFRRRLPRTALCSTGRNCRQIGLAVSAS